VQADDPEMAAMLAGRPAGAMGALCLMDEGPASLGADWDGFDMLLYANLSDEPLEFPAVGVGGPGMLASLVAGGFARSAEFGGEGYEFIDTLDARGIYAMLVPEGTNHFSMYADECEFTSRETLATGETMYMVPEPATLSLLAFGALVMVRRRRRKE